jgi:hypothetical protein
VMRTRQNAPWWHYVVGGALLGCLPGLVLAIMDLRSRLDVVAFAFGAPYGALSGLAFWVLGSTGVAACRPTVVGGVRDRLVGIRRGR